MNTLHKTLLIGLTVLGLGSASVPALAHADAPGSAASGEQRQASAAKWAERRAERQQRLRDDLKLTAEQQGAWSGYVAAHQPAARTARPDRAAWQALSAPERMQRRLARHKLRTATMESRLAALNGLYAVLTAEQKQVFDQRATARGAKHGPQGRHGRMGA